MSKRGPLEERRLIVERPSRRPYGIKLLFFAQSAGVLGNFNEVCLPLETGAFLTIAPTSKAPWQGGTKFVIMLEGFTTATAAEAAGRRLVLALLWMAVSLDIPIRLEYTSYEPAIVFERNRSDGMIMQTYAEAGWAPDIVLTQLEGAYAKLADPDPDLLLSMELFCGARLEASERAVFLMLVSSLEPLAKSEHLGPDVESFVKSCLGQLRVHATIPIQLKDSLAGRLRELRQESIAQALRRLVREWLPTNADATRILDNAYNLRSQIIHNGASNDPDIDLDHEAHAVSGLIRQIYSSRLQQSLFRPSGL